MAPKKKGQKMDLSSFLADTATGNWADEMEDIPIAPSVKDPNALKRGDPGYFDSIPDRSSSRYPDRAGGGGGFGGRDGQEGRGGREELPLPTRPPYTAFVGNLAFETIEDDLQGFFEGLETVSTKLIKGHDDKPKGFGYVEFTTLDGLKEALERSGGQMQGRTVRVSVAEPPKTGGFGGGFGGGASMAESADQWRRSGPLPPRSPTTSRATPSRTFSSNRFDADSAGPTAAPIDRDWSAARGSKFTSNADAPAPARRESGFSGLGERGGGGLQRSEGGFNGAAGGNFRDRMTGGEREPRGDRPPPLAETPDDWRSNRPPREAAPPVTSNFTPAAPVTLGREASHGPKSKGGFMEREPVVLSGQAAEETWSRGSKFTATEPPAPRPEVVRKESVPAPAPRVELEQTNWRSSKPASKEPTPTSSAQASPHPARAQPKVTSPSVESEAKPSKIGSDWRAARPERKVEEKPAVTKPTEGEAPVRGQPPMNRGGLAAAGGNFPRNMPNRRGGHAAGGNAEGGWRRGPAANSNAPATSPAATTPPAQPKQKAPVEPVVDEDGFTVASGSAARRQGPQQAAKLSENKNENSNENRNKFSFAAAKGMDDFVEGSGNDETEGITKGVNETQI